MIIKTVDLVTINEAAKALKQKDFIYLDGYLYGLDNINGYITYVYILENLHDKYNNFNGMVINARELSAFIKTISSETEFNISFNNDECILTTFMDGVLHVNNWQNMISTIKNKLYSINYEKTESVDITNDLYELFNMKKTDGCFYYRTKINDTDLFMTLFPGLLPLNKSDKVLLSITNFPNSFISYFSVIKKKFTVYVILCYLKV